MFSKRMKWRFKKKRKKEKRVKKEKKKKTMNVYCALVNSTIRTSCSIVNVLFA